MLALFLGLAALLLLVSGAFASSAPSYAGRKDEYEARWGRLKIQERHRAELTEVAHKIIGYKDRYKSVEALTGVPWPQVAILCERESGQNFHAHLHNGDSLARRTYHVPAGRPAAGNPPFRWEESCVDALCMQPHALHKIKDWYVDGKLNIARWSYETEKYNGWGYYYHGVPSAYLYSFCYEYLGGKYIADGVWSSSAQDTQVGAITVLKILTELDPSILTGGTTAPVTPPVVAPISNQPAPTAPGQHPKATPPAFDPKRVGAGVTSAIGAGVNGGLNYIGAHPYIIGFAVVATIVAAALWFFTRKKKTDV